MPHANYLFTSESVSEGHPYKVCDQISDAILDAFITKDVELGIAEGLPPVRTRLVIGRCAANSPARSRSS